VDLTRTLIAFIFGPHDRYAVRFLSHCFPPLLDSVQTNPLSCAKTKGATLARRTAPHEQQKGGTLKQSDPEPVKIPLCIKKTEKREVRAIGAGGTRTGTDSRSIEGALRKKTNRHIPKNTRKLTEAIIWLIMTKSGNVFVIGKLKTLIRLASTDAKPIVVARQGRKGRKDSIAKRAGFRK
jgi:hypothetical protein